MTRKEFWKSVREFEKNLISILPSKLIIDGMDMNFTGEQLAMITELCIRFGDSPSLFIEKLLCFSRLKCLCLFECNYYPSQGSSWEGVSKLQNLESLTIRYCATLPQNTLDEISCLSNLSILRIIAERMDDGLDYSVLGKLKNLRYLELEANIWAEDLAFVQNLPNLEVLILDRNAHLDLSHFDVPKSVKFIVAPSYAVKELRESVGDRCHVVSGDHCYGKDKYRFMRPREREIQEEKDKQEAKRLASLKRRMANVKSEMDKLMTEPLLPELGKERIAQINAHLLELEKSL